MSTDSGDDAPVEITLTQSKDQVDKQIVDEKLHHKRQSKNAKKRKPQWAKSQKKKETKEMSASPSKDDDFKDDNDSTEPPIKKRRIVTWMEESDLFHHNKNEIDDTQIEKTQNENPYMIDDGDNEPVHPEVVDEDEDENEGVPQEVIDLFEEAVKDCKTEKELEDKWKEIIDQQSRKYAHLKHKLSKFDKVFINGFQIEVNGVDRLNTSALKRALTMKHFSEKGQHRIEFNKNMCLGSTKPSFAFIQESVNTKHDPNKKVRPSSFWGSRLAQMQKAVETDELEKWLEW